MTGCLEGIRVLELARYQAGPRAGMVLSDMGAEVIKIEKPGGEESRHDAPMIEGQSVYFSVYNRGKKSICLDLRKDEGKAVFRDLAKTADFVLENFRPGTMDAMGFGYLDLCRIKPDIILLSASAFGQTGPYRDRTGFDPVGQAMSGLMALTGQPVGQPVGTASSIVDRVTALHLAIGALGALRYRDKTGEGQVVEVSLMDSALTLVEIPLSYYLRTGVEGGESGRPPYKASDGYVVILANNTAQQRRFAELIGLPPDQFRAVHGRGAPPVEAWCASRTMADIVQALNDIEVPVAPVLEIPQVAQDPHVWQREMMVKMEDALAGEMYLPGLSIKLSKTPGEIGPVPTPGQHTDEVLSTLGYDRDSIGQLRSAGAIA